ncbi:MAG TPA: hypothetical protein VNH11_31665 [Pirellulales bacterium]|nr:hypothetical protein [Pirellulales bacterium]
MISLLKTKAADCIRQRIVELRKQNQSIYDISQALKKECLPRTPVAVGQALRQEGFAKLPRKASPNPVRWCRTPTRSACEEREKEAKPRLRFGLV